MSILNSLWQAAPPEKRREVERRGIERRTSGIYDLIDAIGLLGARGVLGPSVIEQPALSKAVAGNVRGTGNT